MYERHDRVDVFHEEVDTSWYEVEVGGGCWAELVGCEDAVWLFREGM